MDELRIAFYGLIMFANLGGDPGRTVVIPDLAASTPVMTPRGATCVEPHTGYIEAAKKDVLSCPSCELQNGVYRLELHGDVLSIDGIEGAFTVASDYHDVIPHMSKHCPSFRLSIPSTATTMVIRKGTLSGAKKDGERFSVLTVTKSGGVTFIARRGGETRSMKLLSTAAAVSIVNRYANHLLGNVPPLADNHWLAFFTLSKTPVVCDLPGTGIAPLPESTIACSNSGYP